MSLRQRLAWRYAILASICLGLLALLGYHEFIDEPRDRVAVGQARWRWSELTEVVVYAMVPVVLGAGWWWMRQTLRPLDELARSIEQIQAHNLHEPLRRTGTGDEVDRLTAVFNELTERLHNSFQQIREFALHASHELKTPLTVMRAGLETALHENRTEKKDWIHFQLEEVQRLSKLVDTLTLLAKADAGQIQLDRQLVRLDDLVRESYEDALVLAEPHQVGVSLLQCPETSLEGDRHRLRQLLLNLVDNAIKYNQPGGTVALALRHAGATAELEIVNTGKGISPELQPRVFERFVRGENALMSAVEGSGLGLTISRWIVQAHNGTIELTSEPGATTRVRVRLPRRTS